MRVDNGCCLRVTSLLFIRRIVFKCVSGLMNSLLLFIMCFYSSIIHILFFFFDTKEELCIKQRGGGYIAVKKRELRKAYKQVLEWIFAVHMIMICIEGFRVFFKVTRISWMRIMRNNRCPHIFVQQSNPIHTSKPFMSFYIL